MRKTKNAEPVAYCGPPIQHISRSFTVYAEPPAALLAMAKECPAITALIVPLSDMAETRRALKSPGTKEAILYGHILKYIQGGKR